MGSAGRKNHRRAQDAYDVRLHCDENPLGKPLNDWTRKEVGRCGEDIAASYLETKGLSILERNWRCNFGEADIIAEDDGELVLVEVKTRVDTSNNADIKPEEAVTYRKRNRYEKLALMYLSKQVRSDYVRFDVIAVKLLTTQDYELHYVHSAYEGGR